MPGRYTSIAILLAVLLGTITAQQAAPIKTIPEQIRDMLRMGEAEQGVAVARMHLAEAEQKFGIDSLEAAAASQSLSLAMSLGKVGDVSERLALAQRSLETRRGLLDDRDPLLAEAAYTLGQAYYQSGDYPDAVPQFEDALARVDSYFGPYSAEVHDYVREYGAALLQTADYEGALMAIRRQATIITDHAGPDHPAALDAYNDLARVYNLLDRYQEAETVLLRLLGFLEAQDPVDSERLFKALRTLSVNLTIQGRFDEGLAAGERALAMEADDLQIRPIDRARLLNNLSSTLIKIGDYEKALGYLDAAGKLVPAGGAFPAERLRIRIQYAMCRHGLGDYDEALELIRQALSDTAGTIPANAPVMGAVHYYSGRIAQSAGELEAAELSFREALRILEGQDNDRGFDAAEALRDLALVELDLGKIQDAQSKLRQAAGLMEKLTGRAHPDFTRLLDGLARAELLSGSTGEAITTGLESEALRASRVRETLSGLPERQALTLAGQRPAGLDTALAAVIGGGGDKTTRLAVAEAVIRSRAVVFDEMVLRSAMVRAGSEPELSDLVNRLRARKATLSNLFLLGPGDQAEWNRDAIHAVRAEIEQLEIELAGQPQMQSLRANRRPANMEELIARLPDSGALLSYIQYGDRSSRRYAAMIVQGSGTGIPRFIDLGPAATIDDAVQAWRRSLSAGSALGRGRAVAEKANRSAGHKLRTLIWDPVADHLNREGMVFVVPDGAVHLVSFAALPLAGGGYFVEEDRVFHYLTSERDLLRSSAPITAGGKMLIVGDAAYTPGSTSEAVSGPGPVRDAGDACEIRNTTFTPLPETGREAHQVGKFWMSGRIAGEAILLGKGQATEQAFREQAGSMTALHLATHGYFLDGECGPSRSIRGVGGLKRNAADNARPSPRRTLSPLLLSGLAFAGVNAKANASDGDDGILTAEEVASLDLGNVRFAVLSACRSGAGTVRIGEGVFGLRRAFLTAGVDTVITNLWDVEDEAGRQWVRAFYSGLMLRNLPISHAVRDASRKLLETRRSRGQSTHPFFWAGWQATGSTG